jgi:hypothetical protein
MNIAQAIGRIIENIRIGRSFLGKPLSAGSSIFSFSTPEVYTNHDNLTSIPQGFNASTAVYSIVMKDADKFGSIPRFVYDAAKREEKAAKFRGFTRIEHKATPGDYYEEAPALTELLNRPNPFQGADMFLTLFRAYWKVCGESFIWLNRGDLERYRLPDGTLDDMAIDRLPVLEMYVLPANLISIIPDDSNLWGILGYVLEVGERIGIRKNDVIHIKMPNLNFDGASRTHLRGMSPLTPGSKTLGENQALTLASMRQAQNSGAKGIATNELTISQTPEQQTQVKRVFDEKINNNQIAGSVAALQGKWNYFNIGQTSVEMELMAAKEMSWKELCFLFKVPYEFFDSHTPYAEKQLTQFGWLTNDLIPACKQLDGELNRALLKAFSLEGKALICTDASDLPEMITAMVDAAKSMQELWCLSPNDVREFMGQERYDDDRFDQPWVPTGRVPLDDVLDPEAQAALDNAAYDIGTNRSNGNGSVPKTNGRVNVSGAKGKNGRIKADV